ncbi:MAG: hypothetical protein CMJ23_00140 [Phycisphaerae bacterium]|nr:hypothetical protein [Phycisphaerae bacterium]
MTRPTRRPRRDSSFHRPHRKTGTSRPGNVSNLFVTALVWLGAACLLGGCASSRPDATAAWRPTEESSSLDPLLILREAADHEALYTLAGGLKPMSTGIWRGSFSVEDPDLTDLREARRALAVLRNDAWYADVQVFNREHDGERAAHGFVVHRRALARMIERHEAFWNPWGITSGTHPSEVVAVVDRMPRADRWRGYGYLFGYPDHAVDFFVESGLAAEDGREVGPGKDREFIQIPTQAADSGRFTYAVPPGHVPTITDRRLAQEAERILAAYAGRRPSMQNVPTTVEELLRLNDRFEPSAMFLVPIVPRGVETVSP